MVQKIVQRSKGAMVQSIFYPMAVFRLREIIEQCILWNTKVHINFIYLEKAFDSIHRDNLWNILLAYGCPEKIVNIIKHFYNNLSCNGIHKKLTDWRQGCVLSPMLFLVAIHWLMQKTIGNIRRDVRWTRMSGKFTYQKSFSWQATGTMILLVNVWSIVI